jgi:hypothetical protein
MTMEFFSANYEARIFKCTVCEAKSSFIITSSNKPTCQNPDCADYLGLKIDRAVVFDDPRPPVDLTPIKDQPMPKPSDSPAMQDLVIADIEERKRIGIERYGQLLKAHTGRDALVDAYQEALDLCIYLRQVLYERDHPKQPGVHLFEAPDTSIPPSCVICGKPYIDHLI